MKLATFVNAQYNASSSLEMQGTQKDTQPYIKKGYYVKENRNGYWVLVKPAKVVVTLKDSEGRIKTFNMKKEILDYYNASRISMSLVQKFLSEVSEGKITFSMDEEGFILNS